MALISSPFVMPKTMRSSATTARPRPAGTAPSFRAAYAVSIGISTVSTRPLPSLLLSGPGCAPRMLATFWRTSQTVSAPPIGIARSRDASTIEPEFSRGMMNNGFIEIYDDGPQEDNSGWRHTDTFGRVHRLPASGIILDFVDK